MATLQSKKYTKGEYKNQTVNFPVIGNATFDKVGNLEVEDESVEEFIVLTAESFNFEVVGEEKEKDPSKAKKDEENKLLKEQLDAMDVTKLSELLDDAGIKREDAAKWTDNKLRKELYKKLAA